MTLRSAYTTPPSGKRPALQSTAVIRCLPARVLSRAWAWTWEAARGASQGVQGPLEATAVACGPVSAAGGWIRLSTGSDRSVLTLENGC
jgi:hypothetical protein